PLAPRRHETRHGAIDQPTIFIELLPPRGQLRRWRATLDEPPRVDEAASASLERFAHPRGDAAPDPVRGDLMTGRVGHDELRRDRWRRRTHVRGVIRQRHVRLVSDATDDRARKPRDRADQRFVVERGEILARAATTRDDHNVQLAQLREPVQRADERLDRADALHLRGREDELDAWIATRDDGLHIAPGRTDRARDDADAPRSRRERALALLCEEALGGEPSLERLETEVRISGARRTNVVDAELAAALSVIELDPPVREDLGAVARRQGDLRGLRREEHRLQLTDVVAKCEVDVTRRRHARLRDFAFDPEVLEVVAGLDVLGQPDGELTDAQDIPRRARDTHPSACRP